MENKHIFWVAILVAVASLAIYFVVGGVLRLFEVANAQPVVIDNSGWFMATVTKYSPLETCNEVCITADGREASVGLIACPRAVPFGAKVQIEDTTYECADRTHLRFDGRYDIFTESYEEAILWGKREIPILILK